MLHRRRRDEVPIGSELPWRRRMGDRWAGWLQADLGLAEPVRIPAIAVGTRPGGARVVVVAGIHGDEFEGGEAARRLLGSLDPARLNGEVVALPVANPLAYAAASRGTPEELDGRDLARTFPGDPAGGPTERLAHHLWGFLRRCIAEGGILVDLHSGGTHYAYAHLAGFRRTGGGGEQASAAAARAFGFQRQWAMDPTPGTLTTESAGVGIASVGCEVTGGAGLASRNVEAYERGLRNVLGHAGVLPGASVTLRPDAAKAATTVRSERDGFATTLPQLGASVREGQELVTLVDPLGDQVSTVAAPHAGEVWAARTCPHVRSGQILALLSRS